LPPAVSDETVDSRSAAFPPVTVANQIPSTLHASHRRKSPLPVFHYHADPRQPPGCGASLCAHTHSCLPLCPSRATPPVQDPSPGSTLPGATCPSASVADSKT